MLENEENKQQETAQNKKRLFQYLKKTHQNYFGKLVNLIVMCVRE